MLQSDKELIRGLASSSDAKREQAAAALEELPRTHFMQHPLDEKLVAKQLVRLLKAYDTTKSTLVQSWVLQVLADGDVFNDKLKERIAAMIEPTCQVLPAVLYYVYKFPRKFQEDIERIKELHTHADEDVRWRVAQVLEGLTLSYQEDIEVLRALMVDESKACRLYAVMACNQFAALQDEDLRALKRAAKLGDDTVRGYADELLKRREKSWWGRRA